MNKIKEIRKAKGLSQRDIEKGISYSQSQIAKWEKNINEPSLTALIELADFFNCSIDYIAGRESEDGIIVVSGNELSKDEEHLIEILRQLNPADKDMVYRVAEMAYDVAKNG